MGEVVIFCPGLNAGEFEINPVRDPSRFCFHFDKIGMPLGGGRADDAFFVFRVFPKVGVPAFWAVTPRLLVVLRRSLLLRPAPPPPNKDNEKDFRVGSFVFVLAFLFLTSFVFFFLGVLTNGRNTFFFSFLVVFTAAFGLVVFDCFFTVLVGLSMVSKNDTGGVLLVGKFLLVSSLPLPPRTRFVLVFDFVVAAFGVAAFLTNCVAGAKEAPEYCSDGFVPTTVAKGDDPKILDANFQAVSITFSASD